MPRVTARGEGRDPSLGSAIWKPLTRRKRGVLSVVFGNDREMRRLFLLPSTTLSHTRRNFTLSPIKMKTVSCSVIVLRAAQSRQFLVPFSRWRESSIARRRALLSPRRDGTTHSYSRFTIYRATNGSTTSTTEACRKGENSSVSSLADRLLCF